MEAVLVEFDVDHNNATECVEALTELMRSFVSKQPKFHSGTIHIEPSTGKVELHDLGIGCGFHCFSR